MGIAANIQKLKEEIPERVKIIAVSKTMPLPSLFEAYKAGQRAFGENKVQELLQKQIQMPDDTEWHLIGHLQTNKVKYVVSFVSLIHSVDSLKLLVEINREAQKINRKVDCLFQMHIAKEETKFGLTYTEASQILQSDDFKKLHHVRICGLMGMATFTNNTSQIHDEFTLLASWFSGIKNNWFSNDSAFSQLSMGMSGDYEIAINAGSTMVRIGSLIFGERNYNK